MKNKSVLVFAPHRSSFATLRDLVGEQDWTECETWADGCRWRGRGLNLTLEIASNPKQALQLLRGHYYNAVLADCRRIPGVGELDGPPAKELEDFLKALSREPDRERRYPFKRIAVVVGDEDEERVDRLIFRMGRHHVGACLRDMSLSPRIVGEDDLHTASLRLIDQIWEFFETGVAGKKYGKKAICTAGGGMTGLYYELGVLKALHDGFRNVDIRDFDLYFGISAGAIAAGFIANGFHIDDLIANLGEINPNWKTKFRLRWRHLNVGDVPRRFAITQKRMLRYLSDFVRGRDELSVAALAGNYATLFGPVFDNSALEEVIREQFSKPGRTNDFRQLSCDLFVGATDQDRRQHVLFGDRGFQDVPISQAIQASAAVNPFFPSVRIHGRYYTDGAVTRTSNIKAAIRRGANLIFVIDPFLPLISEEPGFNLKQGNLWVIQQDFKTMAYTRFEQVSEEVLRQNQDVNCYTFVPSNRMREQMTQNPLVSKNFDSIVTHAYRSTYRRLSQLEYKISGELAAHGIELDLRPVADRVVALKRRKKPDARVLLS